MMDDGCPCRVGSAGGGACREEKSITLMHPPTFLTSAPSPGNSPSLGNGSARRSVLPGQRQVSSRRWHPAGAPPLRKVYLT